MKLTPIQEAQFNAYRKAMVRFQHPEWFGIGQTVEGTHKQLPIHANGKNHPHPNVRRNDDGVLYRLPSRKTQRMRVRHLCGERALFHISRGDRPEALLALDIDGLDEGGDWRHAAQYGHQILAELARLAQLEIEAFAEPGRSWPRKGGAYLWIRVQYEDLSGPARWSFELRLNRLLKAIAATIPSPAGVKFDALKGCTTFTYSNPRFDSQLAGSDSDRHLKLYEVSPDVWLPKRSARKWLMAKGRSREEATLRLASLRTRWEVMSKEEAYTANRIFYGIRESEVDHTVRAKYCPELERIVRHRGILVTDPCYAAFSGHRENNVPDFIAWANKPGISISAKTLAHILPAEDASIQRARQWMEGSDIRPARKTPTSVPTMLSTQPSTLPYKSTNADNDMAIAETDCADPMERMRAWNRYHMRLTGGDVEKSAAMTVALYEGPGGPATGHSQAEHEERLDRARRHCERLAASFNPQYGKDGQDGVWLTRERILGLIPHMQRLIPEEWRAEEKKNRPKARSTYRAIAAVYAAYLRLVSTTANGWGEDSTTDVPTTAIEGLLASLNMSQSRGTIASCTRLLRRAGLIVLMRRHWHPTLPETMLPLIHGYVDKGRAAAWAINTSIFCPEWAQDHIPACSRVADVEHAHHTPTRPLSPSPFDKEEYGNTHRETREELEDAHHTPTRPLSPSPFDNGEYGNMQHETREELEERADMAAAAEVEQVGWRMILQIYYGVPA